MAEGFYFQHRRGASVSALGVGKGDVLGGLQAETLGTL